MDDLTQGEQETAEQEEQQITKLPKGIDASKLFSNPYLSRPARRQVKKVCSCVYYSLIIL